MIKRKQRSWRGIFDRSNKLVGIVEQSNDGWHVIIGGRDVGVVTSPDAAATLIDEINKSARAAS